MPSIFLLAALSGLGELASMIYLPSIPAMAEELGVGAFAIQSTISLALFLFALSQLVLGPASDRFGRKAVLLPGLLLYLVGSAICYVAQDFAMLMSGRLLQTVGACSGLVIARAVLADFAQGAELAKKLAIVNIVVSAAPAIAPLLGGALQDSMGWRSSFGLTLGLGVLLVFWTAIAFPKGGKQTAAAPAFGSYLTLFKSREFLGFGLSSALVLGALFAFLVSAPALIIGEFGVAPSTFGSFPMIAIAGFVIGGIATGALARKISVFSLYLASVLVCIFGAGALLASVLLGVASVASVLVSITVFSIGLGIAVPLGTAEAMAGVKDANGAASGGVGFVQLMAGAAGSALSGVLPFGPGLSIGIAMTGMLVAALLLPVLFRVPPAVSLAYGK